MTGSNLPPGVTNKMIEDAMGVDGPCECCGHEEDECVCPECDHCQAIGRLDCYKTTAVLGVGETRACSPKVRNRVEPLTFTRQQKIGQIRAMIAVVEENIQSNCEALDALEVEDEDSDVFINDKQAEELLAETDQHFRRWLCKQRATTWSKTASAYRRFVETNALRLKPIGSET